MLAPMVAFPANSPDAPACPTPHAPPLATLNSPLSTPHSGPAPSALPATTPPAPEPREAPHSATPTLSASLSPRDLDLLASLFALDFDYKAWTARHNLATPDLIDFSANPSVRAAINTVRSFADLADQARHRARRRDAIDRLHHILLTAPDPEVQRKAASALLRATAPPVPSRPRPGASTMPAAGAAARTPPPIGLPSDAPTTPAHSPTPWVEPHTFRDDDPQGAAAAAIVHARPHAEPEFLIDRIARAFHPRAETTEHAFRILHAALAPDATIDGKPPAKDFPTFFRRRHDSLPALADSSLLVPMGSEHNDSGATVYTMAASLDGKSRFINFHLAAARPNRWRITRILTQRDFNSG